MRGKKKGAEHALPPLHAHTFNLSASNDLGEIDGELQCLFQDASNGLIIAA
jgi:hypothetical protein